MLCARASIPLRARALCFAPPVESNSRRSRGIWCTGGRKTSKECPGGPRARARRLRGSVSPRTKIWREVVNFRPRGRQVTMFVAPFARGRRHVLGWRRRGCSAQTWSSQPVRFDVQVRLPQSILFSPSESFGSSLGAMSPKGFGRGGGSSANDYVSTAPFTSASNEDCPTAVST